MLSDSSQVCRRRRVGKLMLDHILIEARRRGYQGLYLETGSQPEFEPARQLYRTAGFAECPSFADYGEGPNSIFMSLSHDAA